MIDNYNFTKYWITKIPIPEHYESYLYKVVIESDKPRNKYIGWSENGFNGIYKGSPITHKKEFYEDLGKYEYEVEALDFGEAQNIIYKEKLMLDDIKSADLMDEYYNESVGGGPKLKNYDKVVNEIQDGIKEGNFIIKDVLKEEVKKFRPWQVRKFWRITGHVAKLKDLLEASDGKWLAKHHRGVITLENYDGPDKHVRIGSYHLIDASQSVRQVTTLKVIFIPKNLWKKLSEPQIKGIGQWDNPPNQTPRLETPVDETAEWIVDTCDLDNITPTHISFEIKLKKDGYTPAQIEYRVKKAIKMIADRKLFNSGEIQRDYDDVNSEDYKNLQKKITAFKGSALVGSAGQMVLLKLNLINLIIDKPTETKFKIFIKIIVEEIGAVAKSEKYDKLESADLRIFADNLEEQIKERNKEKINIQIEKLEFTKPNPLLQ